MELTMQPVGTDGTGFGQDLDEVTIARARRGDAGALEGIYRRYSRSAYALALRVTGNVASAEDVVQEAFLRAFERIGSYRGEAGFGAWLKRLVANAAIDRVRAERRWVDGEAEIDALSAPGDDAEHVVEALGLMVRLSPVARTVLWLHQIEGWSHVEIAARFGNSESWSKSILARGLQRVRSWLDAENGATS